MQVDDFMDFTDISRFFHQTLLFGAACSNLEPRFEPSSRTLLTGEQPDPWELLHPQDRMSRHRGAEQGRRYGLAGPTSLLSPR